MADEDLDDIKKKIRQDDIELVILYANLNRCGHIAMLNLVLAALTLTIQTTDSRRRIKIRQRHAPCDLVVRSC